MAAKYAEPIQPVGPRSRKLKKVWRFVNLADILYWIAQHKWWLAALAPVVIAIIVVRSLNK